MEMEMPRELKKLERETRQLCGVYLRAAPGIEKEKAHKAWAETCRVYEGAFAQWLALAAEDKRKLGAFEDLLAALQSLREHAGLFEAFRDDVGQAVLAVVEAAIAKAKGGVAW